MKVRISLFRTVAMGVLLTGFILSSSSCASSKASARRRMIESEQSYQLVSNNGPGSSGQPDRAEQNKAQSRKGMKGPYKPQQGNDQQKDSVSKEGNTHDNGFGNAIGGVITWLLNGLFGSN